MSLQIKTIPINDIRTYKYSKINTFIIIIIYYIIIHFCNNRKFSFENPFMAYQYTIN